MNKFKELVKEWEEEGYTLIDENLVTFTNGGVNLGFHLGELSIWRKEGSQKVLSYFSDRELDLIAATRQFLPHLYELKDAAYQQDTEIVIREDGSIWLEYPVNTLCNLKAQVYHLGELNGNN